MISSIGKSNSIFIELEAWTGFTAAQSSCLGRELAALGDILESENE